MPVLDSHTHIDITLEETGVGGPDRGGCRSALAAAGRAWTGSCRSASTCASSQWGVGPGRAARRRCWPRWRCTPTTRPRLADLDEALREIEALAAHPRVRGVGETGLDYFRTGEDGRAAQQTSFRAHIAIAKRYGKALVIHDRDAHADILRVLDDEGAPGHASSCTASPATRRSPRECVERGLPAQLRRHRHLQERAAAARGGRGHAAGRGCWSRPTRRS